MVFISHHLAAFQSSCSSGCPVWWDEAMEDVPDECEPEWLDAEDPLFILYTSGSTGKPKVPRPTAALYQSA